MHASEMEYTNTVESASAEHKRAQQHNTDTLLADKQESLDKAAAERRDAERMHLSAHRAEVHQLRQTLLAKVEVLVCMCTCMCKCVCTCEYICVHMYFSRGVCVYV